MVITREYLAQYRYLEQQIKSTERKLKYYETHPVVSEHGVVKGSAKAFPFIERHFTVSAPHVKSDEERKNTISQLIVQLEYNKNLYEDMKLDIDLFIAEIPDLELKTMFEMYYNERSKLAAPLGITEQGYPKKLTNTSNPAKILTILIHEMLL